MCFQQNKVIKRKKSKFIGKKFYWLTIIPVIVIAAITTYFFGKYQNSLASYVFSAVIGLLSGLLASIITTLLLEMNNYKKSKQLVTKDFETLKIYLDELFQEMSNYIPNNNSQVHLTFDELFHRFAAQIDNTCNVNALDKKYVGMYVWINLIVSIVDKITTGEEKIYMLTKYDDIASFLMLSKSISNLGENLFDNGNYNYEYIYSGIYDFLTTNLQFYDLFKKEYSSNNKE